MRTSLLVCALACGSLAHASTTFNPGTVFDGGEKSGDGYFYNITAGGSISTAFVTHAESGPFGAAGQIAWSPDLTTAYYADYDTNTVLAVDPNGVVTTYATGITHPLGLLMTSAGRLLVASNFSVFDITGGGPAPATPFITGLSGPRNMLEVSPGVIYIAADVSVSKYANGVVTSFATGLLSATGLVEWNGHLYASSISVGTTNGPGVYDITAGGAITAANLFASGTNSAGSQNFIGLTVDSSNRLLANVLSDNRVYNISAGGVFSTSSPTFASIPVGQTQDAFLGTVPNAFIPTPEPGSLLLVAAGLLCAGFRRRRR